MSKFCDLISNEPAEEFDYRSMAFSHLEELTDWLLQEADQLDEDFAIKCGFIQQQLPTLLKNEKSVSKLKETFFAKIYE